MKRQMVDMLAELIKIPSDPFSDKQEVLDYVQSFTDQIHMRNTLFGDSQSPALLAEFGQGGSSSPVTSTRPRSGTTGASPRASSLRVGCTAVGRPT